MGRDSDRIAELTREVDANPHSRQFYQLGELLRREGRWQDAAAVLRRGLQHWPRYVAAWVSLGRAELQRAAPEAAIEALERAIELDPENPVAWRLLAEAREVTGDSQRALAAMRRAAGLVPGDETLLQALERLEAQAGAAAPAAAPAVSAEREVPEAAWPAGQGEGGEGEETAVMAGLPLPPGEPFEAFASVERAHVPVREEKARVSEVEPPGLDTTPPEVFPIEAEGETVLPPAAAPLVAAAREESPALAPLVEAEVPPGAAPVWAEVATPLADLPLLQVEEVAPPPFAAREAEPAREVETKEPVFAKSAPAPAPGEEAEEPLAEPFAPLEVAAAVDVAESEPLAADVFALEALAGAGGPEDVFGLAAPPPPAEGATAAPLATWAPPPPPPAVESVPPPTAAEASPWATQVRPVLPVPPPPPLEAAEPVPETPPGGMDVILKEQVVQLAGEPVEDLRPPVAEEPALPPEPSPVQPVVSVEAARALIRAERPTEAVAVLEQVLAEHPEDGEARDLLELVREMLAPMPVEPPPPSVRARKIAALQRWLASLTLAGERTAS